jgi:hypothetical protein
MITEGGQQCPGFSSKSLLAKEDLVYRENYLRKPPCVRSGINPKINLLCVDAGTAVAYFGPKQNRASCPPALSPGHFTSSFGGHRMKLALVALALPLLLGVLIAQPATARAPKAQLFSITDVQVKPSMAAKFESGVKRQIELAYPGVFYTSNTEDFHYYFVEPIANLAGIDTINAREEGWMKTAGKDNIAAIMKRLEGAIHHYNTYVFLLDPALGYYPAKPRLKPEEAT